MTTPGAPVPDLVDVVADATREAIERFRTENSEDVCVYALVTTGEALRPYLTVTVRGEGQWDLADSPYAIVEDDVLARTDPAFAARGQLNLMNRDDAEREFWNRLLSIQEALRRLDQEGLFGRDAERDGVLLLVATMPPDHNDAGFARRLNPSGPLLEAWLREAAEGE